MNKMNKKGFTLIEMIVVIVLIGLVAIAAIPNVIKLMTAQTNEKFDTHMKLVEQALDLYTMRYKGDFDNYPNANIYRIDYNYIDKELEADDIECEGVIDLTKKKNNSYSYTYYLTCGDEPLADQSSKKYVDEKDEVNNHECNSSNKCVELPDPR